MARIDNYESNTVVTGTSESDYIFNASGISNVKIEAGGGNDTIENHGGEVTIFAGAGDDSIYTDIFNMAYENATVYGGDGNDIIKIRDHRSLLIGDAGNDIISVYSGGWTNNTLQGGTGDDIIYGGSSNIFIYSNGDGNDIFWNIGNGDTISVASNNGYSSIASGSDIILNVGSGSMTLKNASEKSINIITQDITINEGKKTQQDVIKDFMYSLDQTELSGTEALDEAIIAASSGRFESYRDLIEDFVSDCKKYSTNTFLKDCCGIILNNDDTGAITGWDAGGIAVKTAESIVEETGSLKAYKKSFTLTHSKSGLKLIWNEPEDTTEAQKNIVRGLYSWWFSGALDLVTESYGLGTDTTVHDINIDFSVYDATEKKEVLAAVRNWSVNNEEHEMYGQTTKLELWVNYNTYESLNLEESRDGKTPKNILDFLLDILRGYSSAYLDATIAHEMTHAIMAANITHFSQLPTFIKEGMAELTIGVDKNRDIKGIVGIIHKAGNSFNKLVEIFMNNTLEDSIKTVGEVNYAAGYTLLRYFAKQVSQFTGMPDSVHCNSDKTAVVLTADYKTGSFDAGEYFSTINTIDSEKVTSKIEIFGNDKENFIKGTKKADTIYGGDGKDTIYGGNGTDSLFGGAGNDLLYGEAGNDTLDGGAGNDTFYGGDGKDVFVYALGGGADVIDDYVAGQDKIKISDGTIANSALKGSDVVLKIGNGTLTVRNAKDSKITVIDAAGKTSTNIFENNMIFDANKTAATLGNGFSGTLQASDFGSKIRTIDASNATKKVVVTGNSLSNTINGGSANDSIFGGAGADKLFGEAGNDTLHGGAGSDTLTGGAGKDVFVYDLGDGKDVIADYTDGQDKIKLTSGTISKTSYSGSDVVFSIGSGSITVKDGNGKKISIVDSSGKTSTKTYSSATSGRSALWFADDDNFTTNSPVLDDLIQSTSTEYSSNDNPETTIGFSAQSTDILQHITYKGVSYDNR